MTRLVRTSKVAPVEYDLEDVRTLLASHAGEAHPKTASTARLFRIRRRKPPPKARYPVFPRSFANKTATDRRQPKKAAV